MEERIYNPNDVIVFRKTTEAFGGLSNMASGFSLYINHIIIPSSEHLYQAMRYPLFPEIQFEIISQQNAMKAKMISNKYKATYSRPDWEKIQIKVMRWVLEIKLAQNWETFGKLLEQTGDKQIVEFSKDDKVWGAKPIDGKLIGVNALGRLLMELRQKYILSDRKIDCIEPINVNGILLYNHSIGRVCESELFNEIYQEFEYDEMAV